MTGKATNDRSLQRRAGERGFALVLAILSLMLLTFLGLTLATTTSTELQIATNYRWSQQALYNAEAGLEAGRVILSNVADPGTYWLTKLPQPRKTAGVLDKWASGSAPAPTAADLSTATGRDFYKKDCDTRGGVGYGKVLTEATTRYENVSAYGGQSLNGAFTVWIRRDLTVSTDGLYSDDDQNDAVVVVAEGVAPYSGPSDSFTRARQAVRVLETRFSLLVGAATTACRTQGGQEGGGPTGENFNPCANLTAGATGSLAGAFGGAEAGGLTSKGVE